VANERILIVDDSKEIQEILRNIVLEPAGYRVLTASSGADGLRLAIEEQPDLVILDEQMPEMTGLQLLQALREEHLDLPVVFMTGHGSEELVVQAFRLGARDYVIKPFEPQRMGRIVERLLEQARQEQEQRELRQQLEQSNRQLQQQVRELNTLSFIGRSVTSRLDLETVLKRVVEAAVFLTRAEEGLLLLREPGSAELVLRAARNIDEKRAQQLRVPVQDPLAGQLLRDGQPILLNESAKVVTGYLVRSLLYAPLRTPERGVFGILGATHRASARKFTPRDSRHLCALADYAAMALENARLYERAQTERQKLQAVLRETGEAVMILDQELRITLCNPAAGAALGISTDAVGQPALEAISQPTLKELLVAASRVERALHTEVEGRGERSYSAQLNPVEGVGYVLMMQDITHLKELDRIKSEFVATASHDLRTPLTAIRGYVDLLEKVGPLNEQQVAFVAEIRKGVTHITGLLGDLLDLGRIEAGYDLEMEPLHLESIVDAVVAEFRPLAEERGQEVRWDPTALPLIRGNPRRLRQVLENLLSNAARSTEEGGWIALEAEEDDGHIVVRVADSGVGIPSADQPHVFERFYRLPASEHDDGGATGLELVIVKSVIEKHGGRIWMESQPGVGSSFSFVLPTMEP